MHKTDVLGAGSSIVGKGCLEELEALSWALEKVGVDRRWGIDRREGKEFSSHVSGVPGGRQRARWG